MNTGYLDVYDKPTQLTEEELAWFQKVCKECIEATGIDILIDCDDHYARHTGKTKDALGTFQTDNIENPLAGNCRITIDNFFIHECYEEVFNNTPNLSFDTLEHVIAHELAHAEQWRHCKRHSTITEELYEKIKSYQNGMETGHKTKSRGR